MISGAVVLCALATLALAKPNFYEQQGANPDGYFHQEVKYTSSSSSFRNNELEHKKDDEGFYSKTGDLVGKAQPKVNSYSQHTEYQNPKFGQSGNYDANNDFYLQQTGRQQNGALQRYPNTGLTNTIGGTNGFSSQSGYSAAGSFSSGSYANLQHLQQQLYGELSRQLQNFLLDKRQEQLYGSSQHAPLNPINLQWVEQELRRNLTRQLQETTAQQNYNRYNEPGTNQNPEQLERLRQTLEQQLLAQLQEGIVNNNIQTSSSSSSFSSTYNTGGYQRPENPIHITPDSHNTFGASQKIHTVQIVPLTEIRRNLEDDLAPQIQQALSERIEKYRSSNYGYSNRPLPDYQTELNGLTDEFRRNFTRVVEDELYRNYGRQEQRGGQYYVATSNGLAPTYRLDEIDSLKREIEDKFVRKLQEQFRQEYLQYRQTAYQSSGTSTSYQPTTYVVYGPPVPLQTVSRDVQYELQRQLQAALQEQERRYRLQHSSVSYPSQYDQQQLLQQLSEQLKYNLTQRLEQSLSQQFGRQEQRGSGYYTVGSSGPNYNSQQLAQLKQQLQDNLLNDLQQGLSKQYSSYSSYSASASFSSGAGGRNEFPTKNAGIKQYQFDDFGMQADDSFSRNLYGNNQQQLGRQYFGQQPESEQVQQVLDEKSRYGHGQNPETFPQKLTREQNVEESGTQQVIDERPGKLHFGHGNDFESGQLNTAVDSTRQVDEKSGQLHFGHGQQEVDFTQQQQQQLNYGKNQDLTQQQQLTQQVDEKLGKLHFGHGQQVEDFAQQQQSGSNYGRDLTQQQQVDEKSGKLQQQEGFTQQQQVGKLTYGQNQQVQEKQSGQYQQQLTQQVDEKLGKLHFGHAQQEEDFGQQPLTQQVDEKLGKLHFGHGQQEEDFGQQPQLNFAQSQLTQDVQSNRHYGQDLTQQQVDEKLGKLHFGQQQEDFTQQQQTNKLKYGQNQQQLTQESGNYGQGLTQQVDEKLGKLHFGQQEDFTQQQQTNKLNYGQNQQQLTEQNGNYGQDLTQQQVDEKLGKLHFGQQQEDFTQQQQTSKLNYGQSQQNGNYGQDLTQQVDEKLGKLHFGQQQEDFTQQQQTNKLNYDQSQQQLTGNVHYGQDLTQQVDEKLGKLHFGQQDDFTQQQSGKLNYGQNQQQLTQDIPSGQDLTQQQQQVDEKVGKLHFGQQQEDLTQQQSNKLNYGQTQLTQSGNQDLTQQVDEKLGKLHFGHGQEEEDFTQQLGKFGADQQQVDKSGKLHTDQQQTQLDEDLTQQQQQLNQQVDKLGKLHQQQEDLSQQQTTGELGKLHLQEQQPNNELGNLHWGQEELTQQQQLQDGNLGKVNRDEFGKVTQQQTQGSLNFGQDLTQQVENFGQRQVTGTRPVGQWQEDLTGQNVYQSQYGQGAITGNRQVTSSYGNKPNSYGGQTSYSQSSRTSSSSYHSSSSYTQGSVGSNQQVYQGGYRSTPQQVTQQLTGTNQNGFSSQQQVYQGGYHSTPQQATHLHQNVDNANDDLMQLLSQHLQSQKSDTFKQTKVPVVEPLHQSQNVYNSYTNRNSYGYGPTHNDPHVEIVVTTPPPHKGFWDKIASKIETAINSAKDTTSKLIDKIKSS